MIRLEYDVQTAGVRVSFILRDGERAGVDDLFEGLQSREGYWDAPQTDHNMELVQKLAQHVKGQEA